MKRAHELIGTTEIKGNADNPVIMAMYREVGHDWVEHDEVAWCAAFVGAMLERSGIRSTRKLNARSYLEWGYRVEPDDAQEGDIAIFERGNSSWQGHVAFVISISKTHVKVLGGNQMNAVNIKSYPRSKLLGIRRIKAAGSTVKALPSVMEVQKRLHELGYYEVGKADGKFGPRTRGAILAFRADNGLALSGEIDAALEEELKVAPKRPVSPERAAGVPAKSRILTAANVQVASGSIGGLAALWSLILDGLDQSEEASGTLGRALELFGLDWLAPHLPLITFAIFVAVVVAGLMIRSARIEDYRTGKTP